MSGEKMRVVALMLVAVVVLTLGETLLAKGMKQTAVVTGGWSAHLRAILLNGYFWGGLLLMGMHFGMYMLALRWADLSFVLPFTALAYLSGAVLAKYYLNEAVTPIRWTGAFIITLGVVLIGVGDTGPARTEDPGTQAQKIEAATKKM